MNLRTLGKGAHFLVPTVHTVIDIGGQDTKVVSLDAQGKLQDFGVNDKCAAGTGCIPVREKTRI